MKKIIFLLMILIPTVTFAGTCETINDTSNTDTRNLTCDKELLTVTKYKTNKDVKVLDNEVCTITCSEEVLFSFEPIKKVLAGMGFSYPLLVSGERKCNAVYKYVAYETKVRTLVDKYAASTGDAKITAKNELINYYAQKQTCDEFNKEDSEFKNKYEYNADVKIKIETSSKVDEIKYNYLKMTDDSLTENIDNIFYDSCDLNTANYTCNESAKTIGSWTSTTRTFGKYTMPYSYVEKYTGEVKSAETSTTCNAKDKYFTSTKEFTKPLSNVTTDNGYKLTLIATNLGNNLEKTKTWNLNVNCWYQVKNLSFPQEEDEEFEELGSTGFMYRIIDLNNPFPDREPNANWKGKENIIISNKDNLSSLQKFIITLDRSNIRKVKNYNNSNSYDTFNLNEMEKSKFILNNNGIVDRK